MAGIKHIEFWVSNMEQSLEFYDRLFPLIGWKKIDENGFSDGNTKVYFIEITPVIARSAADESIHHKREVASDALAMTQLQSPGLNTMIYAGPRHICFLAESKDIVDEVGLLLKNSGAEIIRGPLESRYNNRSSYTVDFKDPDGYILEVATESKIL